MCVPVLLPSTLTARCSALKVFSGVDYLSGSWFVLLASNDKNYRCATYRFDSVTITPEVTRAQRAWARYFGSFDGGFKLHEQTCLS